MLVKDMEMLAWNLKGWSTRHSGLGRMEKLWNFVDDIWYFFAKNRELKPLIHIWDLWSRFGHYSALHTRIEPEVHWEKNFGVRTDVQSVPLTQTIHTNTIACSLSALLWLLIVHFEELRFERISLVQNARNEVCFLADLSSFDLTDYGVGRFFRDRIWNL